MNNSNQSNFSMYYLLLSIFCNALLFFILKYYERFKVNSFQAIVMNYILAASLGLLNNKCNVGITDVPNLSWAWITLLTGILFILIFTLLAKTAREIGVSVAAVANKMSVIIPVAIALLFYHDSCTVFKIAGVFLALIAVYFTSKKETSSGDVKKLSIFILVLPLIVFIGSGIIDALINFAQKELIRKEDASLFIAACFFVAGSIGMVIILFRIFTGRERFEWKSIPAGIILGIPNYLCIYGMIRALNSGFAESSKIYPLNNMGIVIVSAAGGFILFREKLSLMNLAGIALSVIAIAMIAFS